MQMNTSLDSPKLNHTELLRLKQYWSDKDLSERYAVTRITVWRWAREGTLPKPIKLSANTTRWRLSDLESFEAAREGKQ